MEDFSFLIPVGFILFFGLMVYWAITSSRQRVQQKRTRAAELGLSPVSQAGSELVQQLSRLRPFPDNENVSVKNIYTRRLPDGNLYIFDTESSSGGDDSNLTENMVLVVSSSLNLPRFGIFPAPPGGSGIAAGLLGKVMQWAIRQSNLVIVPVEQSQIFSQKYVLLAEAPVRVANLVESGLLDQLAAIPNQHIEAEGNAFTYNNLTFARSPEHAQAASLTTLIDQAQRVLYILEAYRGAAQNQPG